MLLPTTKVDLHGNPRVNLAQNESKQKGQASRGVDLPKKTGCIHAREKKTSAYRLARHASPCQRSRHQSMPAVMCQISAGCLPAVRLPVSPACFAGVNMGSLEMQSCGRILHVRRIGVLRQVVPERLDSLRVPYGSGLRHSGTNRYWTACALFYPGMMVKNDQNVSFLMSGGRKHCPTRKHCRIRSIRDSWKSTRPEVCRAGSTSVRSQQLIRGGDNLHRQGR